MKRSWFGIALFFSVVIAAGWLVGSHISLATLADRERSARDSIAEHPLIWWMLGFLVYVGVALVPGTRGKAVAVGWLFGFWPGLILVNGALTIAALIAFIISRHLLQEAVAGRYGLLLGRINRALETNGAFYVILLRVVSVSFSLTNYLLGATQLRTRTYWWATQVGLLPGNVVFVNAGAQLPSLHEVVNEGWLVLLSWEFLSAIALLSIFALLAPRVVVWWHRRLRPPR
jgi:uncharacterized membrane protein YdjX (TVP38/TMEM64 family)